MRGDARDQILVPPLMAAANQLLCFTNDQVQSQRRRIRINPSEIWSKSDRNLNAATLDETQTQRQTRNTLIDFVLKVWLIGSLYVDLVRPWYIYIYIYFLNINVWFVGRERKCIQLHRFSELSRSEAMGVCALTFPVLIDVIIFIFRHWFACFLAHVCLSGVLISFSFICWFVYLLIFLLPPLLGPLNPSSALFSRRPYWTSFMSFVSEYFR